MANNQLRQTIENYISAFNSFDVEKMVSQFADDCKYEVISNLTQPVVCEGKEKFRVLSMSSNELFTERLQQVTNWIISDSKAAIEYTYSATIAKDLPNGLKAGQKLHLRGIAIYEFEGPKIKRLMDFG